jgi:GTPase Era involved in 16S rRNA processing
MHESLTSGDPLDFKFRGTTYKQRIRDDEKKSGAKEAILIGKGGEAIKRLGKAARAGIEAFVGKQIYLDLTVDVAQNWRKDERKIRSLGQV